MTHKRRRGTAIVDTPDGILVVSEGGRTYHLPGGVARKNESRREAVIRELREETGLIAKDCSFLFEYISFSNRHKVFLIKCTGTPKPRSETRHLAYFDGTNVNVSDTARKIIERYRDSMTELTGFCPECRVRLRDFSKKRLYECPECERYFCSNHLDPRLAFFSATFHVNVIKDKKYRELVESDMHRNDAHPCVPYTEKRIKEIEYENKKVAEMLDTFLDKPTISWISKNASDMSKQAETDKIATSSKTYERRIDQREWRLQKKLAYSAFSLFLVMLLFAYMAPQDKADILRFYFAKTDEFFDFVTSWGWLVVGLPIPIVIPSTRFNLIFAIKLYGAIAVLFLSLYKRRLFPVVLALLILLTVGSLEYERCTSKDFGTRADLVAFLLTDSTDRMQYTPDFNCEDFSRTLIQHANDAGYRLYFHTTYVDWYGTTQKHAICKAYIVSEDIWVEIEPQTDEIETG